MSVINAQPRLAVGVCGCCTEKPPSFRLAVTQKGPNHFTLYQNPILDDAKTSLDI
jgi:hypothetical protein